MTVSPEKIAEMRQSAMVMYLSERRSKGRTLKQTEYVDLMVRAMTTTLRSQLSGITDETSSADELTEDHLQRLAEKMMLVMGWKAGDAIGFPSVRQLLVRFGFLVSGVELDECGYPECGCDDDAACSAAMSKMTKAEPTHDQS